MQSSDETMRTYDGKYTVAEWWSDQERTRRARKMTRPFEPFVEAGDLVFDIGSNRGVITLLFRWLEATVIAVDPLYAAAPQFVREFGWKFGEDGDVIAVPMAVSDHEGEIAFHIQRHLPHFSTVDEIYRTKGAHAKYYSDRACLVVEMETTTLNALIAKYGEPAFIKIDVEGHETAVVRGLTVPVKALNFEFHQDRLRQVLHVIRRLDSLADYEYNYVTDQISYKLEEWTAGAELLVHLRATLKKSGHGSHGDIYARRGDMPWR